MQILYLPLKQHYFLSFWEHDFFLSVQHFSVCIWVRAILVRYEFILSLWKKWLFSIRVLTFLQDFHVILSHFFLELFEFHLFNLLSLTCVEFPFFLKILSLANALVLIREIMVRIWNWRFLLRHSLGFTKLRRKSWISAATLKSRSFAINDKFFDLKILIEWKHKSM